MIGHEIAANRIAMQVKWRKLLLALGVGFCAWNWGHAAWIEAKAVLAQVLLEQAWAASLNDDEAHSPWPWADTHPIARLRVPRLGVDQIVLAGASARTLAFGPAHLAASAKPGTTGTTILSGHRDTHFSFLQDLRRGDLIRLTDRDGQADVYIVSGFDVIDARTTRVSLAQSGILILTTCYPFDAIVPGGPMRYVVFATRPDESTNV